MKTPRKPRSAVARIVELLKEKPRTTSDLAHELGIRVPSVTQVLSILRAAGRVRVFGVRPLAEGERGSPKTVWALVPLEEGP